MNFFVWTVPLGPDDPFGTPLLAVLDSVRLLIVLLSIISLVLLIPALWMTWSNSQRNRIICLGLFSIYISLTELQRLGDYGNWRLALGIMVAIWTLFAVVGFIQFEGDVDRAPKMIKWMTRKSNVRHVQPRG